MSLRGSSWQRIGIRPWRLIVLLVGLATVVFVALPITRLVLPACDAQEKEALVAEFPQYGGRVAGTELPIHGDELNFPPLQEPPPGCALEFVIPQASPKQVVGYYEKKLTEHGWTVTVKRFPASKRGFDVGVSYNLVGSRGDLRYVVYTFQFPGSRASEIRVNVYKP
jgi:hypothetical protein